MLISERCVVHTAGRLWLGNYIGETSERRAGAHMGFSERIDTILN